MLSFGWLEDNFILLLHSKSYKDTIFVKSAFDFMADYILGAHVPGAESRYIASKTGLKYWSRGAPSRYIASGTGLKYWSRAIT